MQTSFDGFSGKLVIANLKLPPPPSRSIRKNSQLLERVMLTLLLEIENRTIQLSQFVKTLLVGGGGEMYNLCPHLNHPLDDLTETDL